MTLFLCGDVMTGRGIDQILSHPSRPELREPVAGDAREYVTLAERANGPVPRPVDDLYVWGDALLEWERVAPAVRIANVETSVTTSDAFETCKGINYRMHPNNVGCLAAARLDVCVLANNHVADFGASGLIETLDVLQRAGIRTAGAGRTLAEARQAAIVPLADGGRVLVTACADRSSGVPDQWAARTRQPGVDLLPNLSDETAASLAARATADRRPGDVVLVSIHWGSNWGYEVPHRHETFAQRLVDGGVDIVHGHSSHHARPIHRYRDRLILYGCGDFINDYEGISGYERYRGDLVLMYFVQIDAATGRLRGLSMTPMRIRQMRLTRAAAQDARWLADTLTRASAPYGTRVVATSRDTVELG
jgi:poly-gamma-glutamate synthesis protein (capsule biosynthesis protein)